ncbi:hypothetical protein MUK42_34735 [Musa troglodytarum]|uniref:14-3-3 domain-containing protein n=1 Tax=Musa troglodytarum TaxID=320322 RepID=A0A9E7G5N8_9LILI|nr:hypothetical protein MUK42_34735 [Musa troglodytarum]
MMTTKGVESERCHRIIGQLTGCDHLFYIHSTPSRGLPQPPLSHSLYRSLNQKAQIETKPKTGKYRERERESLAQDFLRFPHRSIADVSKEVVKMSPADSSREDNVYMTKPAEQAERYEEMVDGVEELTVEERNLLSVAYKNVIGARRASWRIISSIEQKEESRGNEDHASVIKEYRGKIETELRKICDGILKLLDSHLIPSSTAAESETGAEWKEAAESTLVSYKSAQDIALAELAPTHPIRLGLALHFSVFYYEIVNTPDRACSLAKQEMLKADDDDDDDDDEEEEEEEEMAGKFSLFQLDAFPDGILCS